MEEDFRVKNENEGTIETPRDVVQTINKLACTSFNNRALGRFVVIVERVDGINTKEKIRWAGWSTDLFRSSMKEGADLILASTVKAVTGGGDNGELLIKYVVK